MNTRFLMIAGIAAVAVAALVVTGCNGETNRPGIKDVTAVASKTAQWGLSAALIAQDLRELGDEWGDVETAQAQPEGYYSVAELSAIDEDVQRIGALVAAAAREMPASPGQQAVVWINRVAAVGYVDQAVEAWGRTSGILRAHLDEMSPERRAQVDGWLELGDRLAGNLETLRDVPGGENVTHYLRDAIALARTAAELAGTVGAVVTAYETLR